VSAEFLKTLAWLPKPDDFRAACATVTAAQAHWGRDLRRLANHALTEAQLKRLAGVIAELRAQGRALAPLSPFKLGLIGNGTLDLIAPALVASAARHGVDLTCVTTDYGQAAQQALDPGSALNQARCDAVLIALDHRGLPLRPSVIDPADAAVSVDEAVAFVGRLRAAMRDASGAQCVIQTLAAPPEPLFGSLDRATPGSMRQVTEAFNTALVASLAGSRDLVFDVASLAQAVGLAEWHSPTQWNMAKLPFAGAWLPLYADHAARILGALRGKSRRALILDLDNTLWGGVIGDDGIEGIVLGEGDPTGEAFLSVQRLALALRERGIALAVSSKNTDEIARGPFRSHPEMLLKESHIAVFQANWNDKASNIKAIADELALGLESLVFLDDNPVERGLVRQLLPEVAIPELPDDPALYARTLAMAGYFEATAFSDEDRKRADFYQSNAQRVALKSQVGGVEDYLASLAMVITFQPFDGAGRVRIAQLIAKSNQFNLTTRRYNEADVEALERDPAVFTLQVRLRDVFGDNGMISVVVCRPRGAAAWEIDTWLMSCRVLGRGVEAMVLKEILAEARHRGVTEVFGTYLPTERNALVVDHYRKLGFEQVSADADGRTEWRIRAETEIAAPPMAIERLGGAVEV
jgi:FkbH-like protein